MDNTSLLKRKFDESMNTSYLTQVLKNTLVKTGNALDEINHQVEERKKQIENIQKEIAKIETDCSKTQMQQCYDTIYYIRKIMNSRDKEKTKVFLIDESLFDSHKEVEAVAGIFGFCELNNVAKLILKEYIDDLRLDEIRTLGKNALDCTIKVAYESHYYCIADKDDEHEYEYYGYNVVLGKKVIYSDGDDDNNDDDLLHKLLVFDFESIDNNDIISYYYDNNKYVTQDGDKEGIKDYVNIPLHAKLFNPQFLKTKK